MTPSEESASLAAADYQRIDIDWEQLDKRRFILFNALFFTGARSLVYPAGLVKTRLQVQTGVRLFVFLFVEIFISYFCKIQTAIYKNTSEAIVHIFRNEGIRGMYKGFAVAATGNIPIQISAMTTYEVSLV
jgi:hypothetical protein